MSFTLYLAFSLWVQGCEHPLKREVQVSSGTHHSAGSIEIPATTLGRASVPQGDKDYCPFVIGSPPVATPTPPSSTLHSPFAPTASPGKVLHLADEYPEMGRLALTGSADSWSQLRLCCAFQPVQIPLLILALFPTTRLWVPLFPFLNLSICPPSEK